MDVNWDGRYQGGPEERPWDIGVAEAELKRCFAEDLRDEKISRALEIGCGTGTNSIWMAEHGLDVLGTEISPTAIAAARAKIDGTSLAVRFMQHDILEGPPVQPETIDFVFDRGVFHVMGVDQRRLFSRNVAAVLRDGGWWLCMVGSADEMKPMDKGPPRLTATEVLSSVEPEFELHSMRRAFFELPDGSEFAAWRVLLRKRA